MNQNSDNNSQQFLEKMHYQINLVSHEAPQLIDTNGDLCEKTIVGILVISTFIARIWRDMESKLKLCFCCHGMMNVEVSDHR